MYLDFCHCVIIILLFRHCIALLYLFMCVRATPVFLIYSHIQIVLYGSMQFFWLKHTANGSRVLHNDDRNHLYIACVCARNI